MDETVDSRLQVLAINSDSCVIRKQIWTAQTPGRFYPNIDLEWQSRQMVEEGSLEG